MNLSFSKASFIMVLSSTFFMIRRTYFLTLYSAIAIVANGQNSGPDKSGNPIIKGWYADPEAAIFNHQYWIYDVHLRSTICGRLCRE